MTDRLSLQLGLWLMLRAERSTRGRRAMLSRAETARQLEAQRRGFTRFSERENQAILTYDMHRRML